MTHFESLANELFLDIFDYFSSIELLHLFFNVNTRLNELLYHYFQSNALDFRSSTKRDFDFICRTILSRLAPRITAIHLSNDDDTPDQVNRFVSYGFHFRQFSHLQSLSLYYIRSIDLTNRLLSQCPRLTSLRLSKCAIDDGCATADDTIEHIWSLSELQFCHLDLSLLNDARIPVPNRISSSLRHLSTSDAVFSPAEFVRLCQCTPRLEQVQVRIKDVSEGDRILQFPTLSLTKLRINFQGSASALRDLIIHLPNLKELLINVSDVYVDGHQWEEMLSQELRRFELFMDFKITLETNIEDELESILESFQTEFWLVQHRWFVQCETVTESRSTHLYTLPFPLKHFCIPVSSHSRLTRSTSRSSCVYQRVQTLSFPSSATPLVPPHPTRFPSVRHLQLSCPFDETLWTMLPRLDRLTSLEIFSGVYSDENDRSIAQLGRLLERAVRLDSLTIGCLVLSHLSSMSITNTSIRRLDLIADDGHFYGLECLASIRSIFDDRCEVLLINLEQRTTVPELLKNLPNLRALVFQCQDDRWGESLEASTGEDELLDWLRCHLPAEFSIVRDESEPSAIQLWIA